MSTTNAVAPSITIAASANPVLAGTTVNFTSSPINGGSSPTIKWYKNGVLASTSSSYSYVPVNGDVITATLTTSLSCVTVLTANSNLLTMQVNPASTTWTGAINNDWFTAGNWNNGVPGTLSAVSIPGGLTNYPTMTTFGNCASFTMQDGASFIGSEYLSVTANNISVTRNVVNSNYHLMSSPTSYTTFGDAFAGHTGTTYAWEFNTVTNKWVSKVGSSAFAVGKGYMMYTTTPTLNATFTGALNKTSVSTALSNAYDGWNLLGNPFQSAIDWDLLTKPAGIDATVHVRSGAGNNYLTWNGSVGNLTDGIIPAENGFYAVATVNGVVLTVPLTARVHSNAPYAKQTPANAIALEAVGNNASDQMFVHFNDNATSQFDHQFDGHKKWGDDDVPQVYSLIPNYELSINELPLLGNEIVNVGFKCNTTGQYTLNATGMESFDASVPIFLKDRKLNYIQDLRSKAEYTFDYLAGDFENRFELIFKAIDPKDNSNDEISIYGNGDNVVVINYTGLAGEVWIRDVTGREILHTNITSQTKTIVPVKVATGAYFVKVVTSKATASQKVILR